MLRVSECMEGWSGEDRDQEDIKGLLTVIGRGRGFLT